VLLLHIGFFMARLFPLARLALLVPCALAAHSIDKLRWLRGYSQDLGEGSSITEFADDASVVWANVTLSRSQSPNSPPSPERFAPLQQLLEQWQFTRNYAIAIGTAEHGRLFLYEGGNFKMTTQIPTGSTSKWPSAMLFAGLVNDGTVNSLDDPVHKYLDWWTESPSDLRSTVTFRMLLSFTSGFGDGHPGQEHGSGAARRWRLAHNFSARRSPLLTLDERLAAEIDNDGAVKCNSTYGDITECARSIYDNVKLIGQPGKVYSYNSNHLQIAAAVAVAATGLDIQQVISKYLNEPYAMHNSKYLGKCPDFGADLITTGEDYEKFLVGMLGRRQLSKAVLDAAEADSTPFMSEMYTLYGDYGFGHFLFCFDSVGGMTDACREDAVHADPGAFGFIPLIDRRRNYYLEVVAAEIPPWGLYPLSGIPEYLAVAIKPHVDAIMDGEATDVIDHLTHNPRFLSLSTADVNYCLNCVLNPNKCS